jgi:hypothetical protein
MTSYRSVGVSRCRDRKHLSEMEDATMPRVKQARVRWLRDLVRWLRWLLRILGSAARAKSHDLTAGLTKESVKLRLASRWLRV